jgi:hypothetical protein
MPRTQIYAILTLVALGLVAGRIVSTTFNTIHANDRSRWCTVRALVHNGTYAIGYRTIFPDGNYQDEGIIEERGWRTIDIVLVPNTRIFYSGKPPLWSTLVAGVYWVVRKVTGWSIIDDQLEVIWTVLLIVNVIPFAFYCVMLGRMVERFGLTDWAKLYIFTAGVFGTFITTFEVVLNNHTPAACAAMAALYFATGCELGIDQRPDRFFWVGFFSGLTMACELPAASLLVCLLGRLWLRHGLRAGLMGFAGACLPLVGWLVTNYLAIGELSPAYAHVDSEWHRYEGSVWLKDSQFRAEAERAGLVESKFDYCANLIIGHHGLFSLTPVFLLAVWGLFSSNHRHQMNRSDSTAQERSTFRLLMQIIWLTVLLTSVVIAFYVLRTSDYGGETTGPRWLFWLTPLLLISSLPVAETLGESKAGRILAGLMLIVSVLSASYHATHPWSYPWPYDLICYIDPAFKY